MSCLLAILGCKCQSDLFDKAQPSPAPSASPTATVAAQHSPTPTPESQNRRREVAASENSLLATGVYAGKGKNLTYNQTGDFYLRIDSVDSDGKVKAYFEASNGLRGKADLEGTINADGKLELSGTLDDGQSAAVSATVKGDTISGGYGLADTNLKTQSGNFTLKRR